MEKGDTSGAGCMKSPAEFRTGNRKAQTNSWLAAGPGEGDVATAEPTDLEPSQAVEALRLRGPMWEEHILLYHQHGFSGQCNTQG